MILHWRNTWQIKGTGSRKNIEWSFFSGGKKRSEERNRRGTVLLREGQKCSEGDTGKKSAFAGLFFLSNK